MKLHGLFESEGAFPSNIGDKIKGLPYELWIFVTPTDYNRTFSPIELPVIPLTVAKYSVAYMVDLVYYHYHNIKEGDIKGAVQAIKSMVENYSMLWARAPDDFFDVKDGFHDDDEFGTPFSNRFSIGIGGKPPKYGMLVKDWVVPTGKKIDVQLDHEAMTHMGRVFDNSKAKVIEALDIFLNKHGLSEGHDETKEPRTVDIGGHTFRRSVDVDTVRYKNSYDLVSKKFYNKDYVATKAVGFHDDDEFGAENKAYEAAVKYLEQVQMDVADELHDPSSDFYRSVIWHNYTVCSPGGSGWGNTDFSSSIDPNVWWEVKMRVAARQVI